MAAEEMVVSGSVPTSIDKLLSAVVTSLDYHHNFPSNSSMIFCRREGPSNVVRALKYCEQKNFVMSRTSDLAALSFGNRFSLRYAALKSFTACNMMAFANF